MKLYLLYEDRLGKIPTSIAKLHDFGRVQIITDGPDRSVVGTSMVLEGPEDVFIDWLKPFDHVWLGQGQPCEERFRVAHIKEPS
jgi:hypothetical protein